MARSDKTTFFDRKLQSLRQETDDLDDQIKSLTKAIRKGETVADLPPSAPPARPSPRIARTTLSSASSLKAQEALERTFAAMGETGIPTVESAPQMVATATPAPADGELFPGFKSAAPESKKKPISNTQKFASYFASGSFGKARPMASEKKVQRNKAIFMLIFALLAAFVLFRMIF
jgi:hypothetical protein